MDMGKLKVMVDRGEVDEFLYDVMRVDTAQNNNKDYLQRTKPILRDEILTCYSFMEEKGLLEEYFLYKG